MIRLSVALSLLLFCLGVKSIAARAENIIPELFQNDKANSIVSVLENKNNNLYDALKLAYQNNPSLRAARQEYLATEEDIIQAQAGFKPNISASADVIYTHTETQGSSFITTEGGNVSKAGTVEVEQPLFKGGTTHYNVRGAKKRVSAQALRLSEIEQGVLNDSSVAYMNILRDQAVLKLNENNYDLVARELERAQNRFQVGELTRTDVSQSEARLAEADAELINAKGQYKASVAAYQQIIGEVPTGNPALPLSRLSLPDSLAEAIELGLSNNRMVLQSEFMESSSKEDIGSIRGELLPQISAVGRLDQVFDQSDFVDEQTRAALGVEASIPLYKGGELRSRLRAAQKTANQRRSETQQVKNEARQEVISNWEALETARAAAKARQSQMKAARVAREGVLYEAEFGERTTLDALNANQELFDAQVAYITARRDEVVAEFALARTLGVLVPQNLGFSTINP